MANRPYIEQLASLDMPMPRTYIGILFVFETINPTQPIAKSLQSGLDGLSEQVPWLSGRVFPTTTSQGRASLKIQSNASNTPAVVDKGCIAASYKTLSSCGMPAEAIPLDVWPVPGIIDDALFMTGASVFAASFFRFTDQGAGLCLITPLLSMELGSRRLFDCGLKTLPSMTLLSQDHPKVDLNGFQNHFHLTFKRLCVSRPKSLLRCTLNTPEYHLLCQINSLRAHVSSSPFRLTGSVLSRSSYANMCRMHRPRILRSAHLSGLKLPVLECTAIPLLEAK